MTKPGEQNDLDLKAIVDEINHAFAGSLSFVYISGDVAEDGSASAYTAVHRAIVSWSHGAQSLETMIVHEKSFDNYLIAERSEREQDNAVGAWPERGLPGTQLGPNKNGRKW